MTVRSAFAMHFLALIVVLTAPVGAQENGQDEAFSKSSTCAAFDTSRDITDYSARIVAHDSARESYEIQVQAVHAKAMASPITKITLSDGTAPNFKMLDDNCICGMRINDVEVDCTHITNYVAKITRETLEASKNTGLAMTFVLENGHIVAGPRFGPEEIEKALSRS